MNGADLLIKKLADAGVSACFANPGTSEMQLVAALDKEPRIRAVLGLFEGVVTGAADGFARMTDTPALTLLHLGTRLCQRHRQLAQCVSSTRTCPEHDR
jgi:acetolactate synthase-1/2/3 large subunit